MKTCQSKNPKLNKSIEGKRYHMRILITKTSLSWQAEQASLAFYLKSQQKSTGNSQVTEN